MGDQAPVRIPSPGIADTWDAAGFLTVAPRYRLAPGELVPKGEPETIVSDLPLGSSTKPSPSLSTVRGGSTWRSARLPVPTAIPIPNFAYLPDDDLAAVLTYVRQAFGNKAPPITPAEVAALRPKPWTGYPEDRRPGQGLKGWPSADASRRATTGC